MRESFAQTTKWFGIRRGDLGEAVRKRLIFYVIIVFLLCTNLALAALVRVVSEEGNTKTGDFVFSGRRGPDTLTLQEIADGAKSDDEILLKVTDYYAANHERLGLLWGEENPTRLAALFTMYVTHISTVYGEAAMPTTLDEYLHQPRSHCGSYTWAQMQLARALGLKIQVVEFSGEHAWLEVMVDEQWELFDATTNEWIDKGVTELMQGVPRQFRTFYSPVFDINRPDARLHLSEGYDVPKLRTRMTTLGVAYMPYGVLSISEA